jgi:hypothetical protein
MYWCNVLDGITVNVYLISAGDLREKLRFSE